MSKTRKFRGEDAPESVERRMEQMFVASQRKREARIAADVEEQRVALLTKYPGKIRHLVAVD